MALVQFSGHLIFHRFATWEDAEGFADHVSDAFNLVTVASTKRNDKLELYPFELDPPIVYVTRPEGWDEEIEREIEEGVRVYGGTFAGT